MTREGAQQQPRMRSIHKKARQTHSLPVMERTPRETPYQDYHRIKRMIQAKLELKGELAQTDLFVDASFPPDRSSLTYVYSGDDKYERAVFRRPKEIKDDPSLSGLGGICDEAFPWQFWKQRSWFQAALVVVSLSVRALERLIPGFRNSEQNFDSNYCGCFHFHLWRFGEWVDVVVDDHLPTVGDRPLFTRPLGREGEMWGPLVEKAYAKCKRTFQAIEFGFTLDALTDLTGSICEFYMPDLDSPSNLFHILYKSAISRSFMVCWRNNKKLTPCGFRWEEDGNESDCDRERYLHLVTAVTKFPVTGGRMEQMIRLKCPYSKEPRWHGRFSNLDASSWSNINANFLSRLQPHKKKDFDEYWMTYEDFRCNFGGLFILSSSEPFRLDGFNISRSYRTHSDVCIHQAAPWLPYRDRGRRQTAPQEFFQREFAKRRTNSDSDCLPTKHSETAFTLSIVPRKPPVELPSAYFTSDLKKSDKMNKNESRPRVFSESAGSKFKVESNTKERSSSGSPSSRNIFRQFKFRDHNPSSPQQSSSPQNSSFMPLARRRKSTGERLKDAQSVSTQEHSWTAETENSKPGKLKKTPRSNFMKKHSLDTYFTGSLLSDDISEDDASEALDESAPNSPNNKSAALKRQESIDAPTTPPDSPSLLESPYGRKPSPFFVPSPVSPPSPNMPSSSDKCFSSSEISLHVSPDLRRPRSATSSSQYNNTRESSPLNILTQSSFLATQADYFRSDSFWRLILEHRDVWSKHVPNSDRTRMDIHSRSQRVYFLVTRHEHKDQLVPPTLQEKRHVLISLLQDYRHGPMTANSLLVPIGFCLYRTKHSDRDEKRHISKLQLIGQVDGEADKREITARFDLDPGGYFLVPYYQSEWHQGEFLIRVLTEGDIAQPKTGCKIS